MPVYNPAKVSFAKGEIAWETDTVHVSLHTSSYTPNIDTHQYFSDVSNEVGASGSYTVGGLALAGKVTNLDTANDRAELDANNVTITGFTGSFRYIILRKFNATPSLSRLISYIDLGSTVNLTGGTYTITWNAEGIVQLT